MIKIMKNKKIVALIFLILIALLLCVVNIWPGILALLILVLEICFFALYHNKVPNIFNDNRRGYTHIIIGSTKVKTRTSSDLLCVAYHRSLQMDEIIMRRMYSFLSKNGTIIMVADISNDKVNGINPPDIYYLHQVTMNELGISNSKIRYYYPFWINPIYSIQYIFWCIVGSRNFKKYRIDETKMVDVVKWIERCKKFCDTREIQIKFELRGTEEDIETLRTITNIKSLRLGV